MVSPTIREINARIATIAAYLFQKALSLQKMKIEQNMRSM